MGTGMISTSCTGAGVEEPAPNSPAVFTRLQGRKQPVESQGGWKLARRGIGKLSVLLQIFDEKNDGNHTEPYRASKGLKLNTERASITRCRTLHRFFDRTSQKLWLHAIGVHARFVASRLAISLHLISGRRNMPICDHKRHEN